MAIFLAVDAGGTKTDYVLADQDRHIARVRGGCIKRLKVSAEEAGRNLAAALEELAARSGVALSGVERCCIGTSGDSVPLVVDWLREQFPRHVGGELIVVGDVEIALDAAFRGGPGLLALSGTGSNTAGRTPEGLVLTAGGWGPMLADQASGHRIGHEGLRAAFLAIDQERETTLLASAAELFGVSAPEGLIAYVNGTPALDFSWFAPAVVRSATQGDAVAQEVLEAQGREIGGLVLVLIRRMQRHSVQAGFVPEIAFAGSIFEQVAAVREAMLRTVRAEFPEVKAHPGCVDPIEGALWQARGKL